jgi:hypothetical protein
MLCRTKPGDGLAFKDGVGVSRGKPVKVQDVGDLEEPS